MLIAKKSHWYSRFQFDLYTESMQKVATLYWPDVVVAENARFKFPFSKKFRTQVELQVGEDTYHITFSFLKRGWINSYQFQLKHKDQVLATANVVPQLWKRPRIEILEPFKGEMSRTGPLWRTCYQVKKDGKDLGEIRDPGNFSLAQRFCIDLPSELSLPVQAFLYFLMMNHAFR